MPSSFWRRSLAEPRYVDHQIGGPDAGEAAGFTAVAVATIVLGIVGAAAVARVIPSLRASRIDPLIALQNV